MLFLKSTSYELDLFPEVPEGDWRMLMSLCYVEDRKA